MPNRLLPKMSYPVLFRMVHGGQDHILEEAIKEKQRGYTEVVNLLRPFKNMGVESVEITIEDDYIEHISSDDKEEYIEEIAPLIHGLANLTPSISPVDYIKNTVAGDKESAKFLLSIDKKRFEKYMETAGVTKEELFTALSGMEFDLPYEESPQVNEIRVLVTNKDGLDPERDGDYEWEKISERKYSAIVPREEISKTFTTKLGKVDFRKFILGQFLGGAFAEIDLPPMLKILGTKVQPIKVTEEYGPINLEDEQLINLYVSFIRAIPDKIVLPNIGDKKMFPSVMVKKGSGYLTNSYFLDLVKSQVTKGALVDAMSTLPSKVVFSKVLIDAIANNLDKLPARYALDADEVEYEETGSGNVSLLNEEATKVVTSLLESKRGRKKLEEIGIEIPTNEFTDVLEQQIFLSAISDINENTDILGVNVDYAFIPKRTLEGAFRYYHYLLSVYGDIDDNTKELLQSVESYLEGGELPSDVIKGYAENMRDASIELKDNLIEGIKDRINTLIKTNRYITELTEAGLIEVR